MARFRLHSAPRMLSLQRREIQILGKPARHFSIISRFAVGSGVALKRMLHESALRYSGRLLNVCRSSGDFECRRRSRLASAEETSFMVPPRSAQYFLRVIIANILEVVQFKGVVQVGSEGVDARKCSIFLHHMEPFFSSPESPTLISTWQWSLGPHSSGEFSARTVIASTKLSEAKAKSSCRVAVAGVCRE